LGNGRGDEQHQIDESHLKILVCTKSEWPIGLPQGIGTLSE